MIKINKILLNDVPGPARIEWIWNNDDEGLIGTADLRSDKASLGREEKEKEKERGRRERERGFFRFRKKA